MILLKFKGFSVSTEIPCAKYNQCANILSTVSLFVRPFFCFIILKSFCVRIKLFADVLKLFNGLSRVTNNGESLFKEQKTYRLMSRLQISSSGSAYK